MPLTDEAEPGAAAGRPDARPENSPRRVLVRGAVTFLDVLGWKGIWLRREPGDVVGQLEQLVDTAKRTATGLRGSSLASDVRVLSISDTIVLLTEGSPEVVLPAHGRICQQLVCDSIRKGIPLRGATGFGDYYASEGSIVVGPAVDESASWHEAVDWIGVVLTPTAVFSWPSTFPPDLSATVPWSRYARVPVKGVGGVDLWCLDWPATWDDPAELRDLFARAGPLDTSIAAKYLNTLHFFTERKKPSG